MGPEHLVFIFLMAPFAIPIVAIISRHRLKEIELKARLKGASEQERTTNRDEIAELRNEVKELKNLVHEQMIAVDTVLSNQTRLLEGNKSSDQLQHRMSSEKQ